MIEARHPVTDSFVIPRPDGVCRAEESLCHPNTDSSERFSPAAAGSK